MKLTPSQKVKMLRKALELLLYTLSDNEIPQSEIKKAYEHGQQVFIKTAK